MLIKGLPFSCQILNGIDRPPWHLADICAHGWNVAQQENGGNDQCKPDDVAIDLLHSHQHHGVEKIVSYIFAKVEMRHVQVRERELTSIVSHVIVEEMGEDCGVNAVARSSCQIHVENVEHEQAHEE